MCTMVTWHKTRSNLVNMLQVGCRATHMPVGVGKARDPWAPLDEIF